MMDGKQRPYMAIYMRAGGAIGRMPIELIGVIDEKSWDDAELVVRLKLGVPAPRRPLDADLVLINLIPLEA